MTSPGESRYPSETERALINGLWDCALNLARPKFAGKLHEQWSIAMDAMGMRFLVVANSPTTDQDYVVSVTDDDQPVWAAFLQRFSHAAETIFVPTGNEARFAKEFVALRMMGEPPDEDDD